jgi:hypothetical protein
MHENKWISHIMPLSTEIEKNLSPEGAGARVSIIHEKVSEDRRQTAGTAAARGHPRQRGLVAPRRRVGGMQRAP